MSFNYFNSGTRSSPSDVITKINYLEEKQIRYDRVKESLEQEFIEYTRNSSKTPQHEGLVKLKKIHNNLCYENTRKEKILKDLMVSIKTMSTSHSHSTRNLSKTSSRLLIRELIPEEQEYHLKEYKKQIKNIKNDIEKESFSTEQLEQMKKKERSGITTLKKKIAEIQEFYKSIARYEENVERLKVRASNDKAQAYGTFAIAKKYVDKNRKSRNQTLYSFKKKEANLYKSIKYMQQKIVEHRITQEDTLSKKQEIVKDLEFAVSSYDDNKAIQMSRIEEINCYSLYFQQIKQVLKESKSLMIPDNMIENASLDEILRFFSQFQSLESHLQIRYSNLTLTHSLLDEKLLVLRKDLEQIKAEDGVSDQINSIRHYASNLKLEESTYSGIRANLENQESRTEEMIETHEKIAMFLLKYILEISFRLTKQLDFVKNIVENHPNILQIYLNYISKLLKELQNGNIVKLKSSAKQTYKAENSIRRPSMSRTTNIRFEEPSTIYSKFSFEKLKLHTKNELCSIFLKEFPGSLKHADTFSRVIYFNNLNKHFISQNDLKKFFKELKLQEIGVVISVHEINKLFNISHKNLRKLSSLSMEIIIEILRKVSLSDHEIRKKTIFKEAISPSKEDIMSKNERHSKSNSTHKVVKTVFEQKMKAFYEEKQTKELYSDIDKFISKLSLAETRKIDKDLAIDEQNENSSGNNNLKTQSISSDELNDEVSQNLIQKKQHKPKHHVQTNKSLPKLKDKKDLIEEIRRIQSGINMIKRAEALNSKDESLSRESSRSRETFPSLSSPTLRRQFN